METETKSVKRRGFLSRMAVGLTLPFAAGAAAAAERTHGKRAPAVVETVDFATWNQVNTIVHAYADTIDRVDLNGLAAIFLPDGVYDYKPGLVMHGREEIKVAGAKMLGNYLRTWHNMSSPTVTVGQTPGTFDAITYFVARHNRKDGGFHALYGRYIDHYARDPASGALLIANRKVLAQMAEGDVGERYWLPRPS